MRSKINEVKSCPPPSLKQFTVILMPDTKGSVAGTGESSFAVSAKTSISMSSADKALV